MGKKIVETFGKIQQFPKKEGKVFKKKENR